MTPTDAADSRPDATARLVAGGSRCAQGIDIDRSVRSLFEARVALQPHAVALETDHEQITYDQLNRMANRLARRLIACGGAPGDRVVILMDAAPLAIAAMLAALKAGCAYVPLDPEFPSERLAFMYNDCTPRAILTGGQFIEIARSLAGDRAAVVNVDEPKGTEDDSNLDVDAPRDAPAYILYTSGSTGRPKGVVQTQRNLLHFVRSYASSLGIQADDRLTLFYSFSFSAALMDIYGGLLTGATVLPHSIKKHGIAGLASWIADCRVTVFHSVPTVFRHLMQTLGPDERLATIRIVDLGGEPVGSGDIEAFKQHFTPGTVVVNHLAATEASVMSQYFIAHDTPIDRAQVAAGIPADGVSILIVDDDLDPVPEGESGEIVVRSEFLSPGYWQNPELTAKAFVVDPKSGARLYRTGDLGRLNAEGLLEHLGRKDFRVKVRGLTIEVAEIEAVLAQSPDVRDVRVVARRFGEGDERLVAFVVRNNGASTGDGALRELVRESLPDYMAPAMFLTLDALPLTPTGKVDHKALTNLPIPLHESNGDAATSGSIEARLIHVWREVLRVPAVNPEDNFFELGGHSLLAMTMLARVEKEFGCQLAANVMAQHPTLRGLADTIRGGGSSTTSAMIVPYRTSGSRPPIFCVAPRHALYFRELATALGPEQPLFGVQPPHADGFRASDVTVEYMASLYADDIARHCPSGPIHVVGFCGGGIVAFEVAHLMLSRGREIGVLALLDTPRHFDHLREHPIGTLRYYARRALHHPRVAFGLPLARAVRYLADHVVHIVRSVRGTQEDADRVEPSPDAWRALAENRDAFSRYRPQPYPSEIDLIFAADSFSVFRDDPRAGWRELAAGSRIHWVPGGHYSCLREPHVGIMKYHLERAIARTQHRKWSGRQAT